MQMETMEMELIKRLQNTQLAQKKAYDDLENALNKPRQKPKISINKK
jgi:hypothetical protein